jgi:hypothetical protein
MDDNSVINAIIKNLFAKSKPCIVKTPLVVSENKERQVYIGQGEGLTK